MASTQALSAAAQERKARLAQLKSLKRKQRDDEEEAAPSTVTNLATEDGDTDEPRAKSPRPSNENGETEDIAARYLSGRNYDVKTKGAKLGFEQAPSEGRETLEHRAAALAAETAKEAETAAQEDKPLDLFALQPRRPNWDLKRDLAQKLSILNVRTDNAIARLVRERIAAQQKAAKANGVGKGAGDESGVDALGLEGAALVEATNVREREDEEEVRREREEEAALLDAS